MRALFNAEHLAFIEEGWRTLHLVELTASINARFGTAFRESQIKCCVKNHKFRCGRAKGNPRGSVQLVTKEQFAALAAKYRTMKRPALVDWFNNEFGTTLKPSQIVSLLKNHKAKSGRSGRFVPGGQPWNTGTKGVMKGSSTTWSKTNKPIPHNERPLGAERISKDGYVEVKVAERNPHTGYPARWRAKHVVVWEQHNGKVPKGHCIRFLDGNQRNNDISNLVLISRHEHVLLNRKYQYKSAPAELRDSVLLLAKLDSRTTVRERATA